MQLNYVRTKVAKVTKLKRIYTSALHLFVTILLLVSILLCKSQKSVAQNCPPNIDFENGNFNGWECYKGRVAAVGGENVITLSPSSPEGNIHTMLSSFPGDGLDPYGNFPVNCPNGTGHSIKLGNNLGEAQAEGISYTFTVPANANVYNLIYNYAVVFQDPNHQVYQQPRLEIEITNVSDNSIINCSSFSFFPFGTPLPGFQLSAITESNTPIWYKDWTAVSINLNGNAGKIIRLSFKTSDCTFRRHFGYAYIDINSECSGRFEGASFCPEDTAVNVIAPYGYQNYTWFNSNFTQVLGSQQTLTLSPPPPTNTQIAVILEPYNGYGCLDTLYTSVTNDLEVSANAGEDKVSCNNAPVQIGVASQLNVKYSWTPIAGLSNPTISNPIAIPSVTTKYILTARSNGGGCIRTDTVEVKASLTNNSIQLLGKAKYCVESGDSAVLFVQIADSIQWYKDDVAIIGANQTRYLVLESGTYYAVIFGGVGCSLATQKKQIAISSTPIAGFQTNIAKQCLWGNQFVFTNSSTNILGAIDYKWILGDGNEASTRDLIYSYSKAGIYNVKMIASSNTICADTSKFTITVYQNPIANFSAPTICVNLPVKIINNTVDTVGSPLNYLWTFADGQTSTLRNPPAPVYSLPGKYDISLFVSSVQCPIPGSLQKLKLSIDKPRDGIRYPLEYGVVSLPLDLEARKFGDSVIWLPTLNLNNPTSFNPIFRGISDQEYTISIKTKSG